MSEPTRKLYQQTPVGNDVNLPTGLAEKVASAVYRGDNIIQPLSSEQLAADEKAKQEFASDILAMRCRAVIQDAKEIEEKQRLEKVREERLRVKQERLESSRDWLAVQAQQVEDKKVLHAVKSAGQALSLLVELPALLSGISQTRLCEVPLVGLFYVIENLRRFLPKK